VTTAKKAGAKAGRFKKGDPRINRTKPGTGRPPDAFKAMCQRLASSEDVRKSVAEILQDSTSPLFVGALKWATENGYGKPKESIEHSGPDGGAIQHSVTVRFVKA
jgi:hypothetical protein